MDEINTFVVDDTTISIVYLAHTPWNKATHELCIRQIAASEQRLVRFYNGNFAPPIDHLDKKIMIPASVSQLWLFRKVKKG